MPLIYLEPEKGSSIGTDASQLPLGNATNSVADESTTHHNDHNDGDPRGTASASSGGSTIINQQCQLALNAIAFDYHLLYSVNDLPTNNFIDMKANDTPRPVIRIYGSLSSGQKACMNVHGMLPYLYFRPLNPLETLFDDSDSLGELMRKFHKQIENYLEFKRSTDVEKMCRNKGLEYRKQSRRHIEAMEIVRTKSIYGYHSNDVNFIKLTYLNPSDLNGILHMLEGGFLCRVVMQAYESHIPYMLKFIMDQNIQPMGWVYVSDMRFRLPLPASINDAFLPPPVLVQNSMNNVTGNNIAGVKSSSYGQLHMTNSALLSPTSFPAENHYFTQSTTPPHKVWHVDEVVLDAGSKGDRAAAAPHGDLGGKDKALQLRCQCTSGLEIDVHIDHILNAKIRPLKFGDELWEEERRRRELRRLPADRVPSQPSTQTCHLNLGEEGRLYRAHLDMMARKGRLVAKTSLSQASHNATQGAGGGGCLDASFESNSSIQLLRTQSPFEGRVSNSEQGLQLQQDSPDELALLEWLQTTQRAAAQSHLRVGEERQYIAAGDDDDTGNLEIIYASQHDKEEEGGGGDDSSDEDGDACDGRGVAEEERDNILLSSQGSDDASVGGGGKRKADEASLGLGFSRIGAGVQQDSLLLAGTSSPFSFGSQGPLSLSQSSGGSRRGSRSASRATRDAYTANGSFALIPTFDPPLPSAAAKHPFIVNPPLHFSDRNDYQSAFGGAGTGAASKGFLQRRHEAEGLYIGPLADFHTGDALAAAIAEHVSSRAGKNTTKGIGNKSAVASVAEGCCLRPTFDPPDPRQERPPEPRPPREVSQTDQIRTVSPTAAPGVGLKHAMDNGERIADETFKARVTVMSIEILAYSHREEVSNPDKDPVLLVAWAVDDSMSSAEAECVRRERGVVYFMDDRYHAGGGERRLLMALKAEAQLGTETRITIVHSEDELLLTVAKTVSACDPDIILGYEVQNTSIGYLAHRARVLHIDLLALMSRFPEECSHKPSELDKYSEENLCDIFIVGRLVLNLWRLLKKEMKVYSYYQSNVAQELLGQTAPYYSNELLNRWFRHTLSCGRPAAHVLRLATLNLEFLQKLDLLRRTAESARLYGIDFISVLTRGSQFRVEAALTRKAHCLGFVTVSPNKMRVANQAAIQAIPLVAEPRSGFYADPVIVLDFTSLYPSMIIAHNLCYSTIIGKLHPSTADPRQDSTTGRLGVFDRPESVACKAVLAHVDITGAQPFVSPNGAVFCNKDIRLGVLPQMLKDILDTRQMIKRSMKAYGQGPDDALLLRSLDARQLAIKMLSNVTYGYAAASFSGRMPMAELADAIVSTGKATLEDAMDFITSNPAWNAQVVYGDTDSIFVLLRGRSKDDALRIGNEMALAVTQRGLPGVELKFEKVYYPCILVTKKRYCGNAWERPGQLQPHFEAKGIECIRSDQCLATAKLQERALRLLFNTRDVSLVKKFLVRQWTKMHRGGDSINVKDFIFYKNVKTGHYKAGATLPPAAELASSLIGQRLLRTPPYKWRMPYVVVYGAGTRLIDLVATPESILKRGSGMKVNVDYYITKCINPALQRVLGLCGVAVRIEDWYAATPKVAARIRRITYDSYSGGGGVNAGVAGSTRRKNQQTLMDKFTHSASCELCGGEASAPPLCASCAAEPCSLLLLQGRVNSLEGAEQVLRRMCDSCASVPQRSALFEKGQLVGPDACAAISCPVFFERCKVIVRLEGAVESMGALTW